MLYHYTPYILPLFLAAAIATALAVIAWRRRGLPGTRPFALMMAATAEWSLGHALETASASLPTAVFWAQVQYLGIVSAPLVWLIFALRYSGRGGWLTRRRQAILAIVPLITLLLVWTWPHHKAIWTEVDLRDVGAFLFLEVTHGPWFWVHTTYSYLLLLLGSLLLLWRLPNSPSLGRRQTAALLVAVFLPWLVNLLYLLRPTFLPPLDMTPFALTLSGLVVALGLFRFQLFEAIPLPPAAIIESMRNGVVVLNQRNEIVGFNPAARQYLNLSEEMKGEAAPVALAAWPDLVQRLQEPSPQAAQEIVLGQGAAQQHYDLRLSPLSDQQGRLVGRLAILHEITALKWAEEELRRRAAAMNALHETALDLTTQRELPDLLRAIVGRAVDLLRVQGGGIYLYRPEHDDLELVFVHNLSPDAPGTILQRGEGLSGRVLESGEPLVVNDYNQWNGQAEAFSDVDFPATVAIPIRWGARMVGALYLSDRSPRIFSPGDIALLERFAPLAGAALEQTRLLEEARARWQEAETLRQAGAAVAAVPNLEERLERILEQLERVVPYDSASVQLLKGDYLEIVGGRGFPHPDDTIGLQFAVPGDNPNTIVIQKKQPLILGDARAAHPPFRKPPHDHIRSWLGVPLMVQDRAIGILAVDSATANSFEKSHLRLITPFANQVAVAIENAQLYEESRQRVAELEVLQQTSLQLISSLELPVVLETIAENALRLVQATNCHIYLYEEEAQTLAFGTALWKDGRRQAAVAAPRSDGLTASVIEDKQAIVIDDASTHPLYADSRAQEWGVQAIAGFPLQRAGRVLGVFTIAFLVPHRFDDAELRALGLLADQAAIAIENARLYEEMAELKEFNESIVQGVAEAILVEDDLGVITFVNPAAERLLGYSREELVGRHWSLIIPTAERAHIQQERAKRPQGIESRYETTLISRAGEKIPVLVSARPLFEGERYSGVLSALTDIRERKQVEEQLRQIQKMEAVGRLAGGVAHDFNNLLLAIGGYTEFILSSLDPDSPESADAKAVLKATDRAAQLTRQLLTFSRRQVMKLRVLDLNDVLQDLEDMLQRIIGEDIEFQLLLDPHLGMARVDVPQMEQVIVNLVVNAREAMPAGGQLTLKTTNVDLDSSYAESHIDVEPGPYVQLSVSDTGQGMTPEVQEHLFEPFFTTKEGGTGLGLAMVYGIITQFGGHIRVYSELQQGTTFKIYLPQVQEPAHPTPAATPESTWPQGSETILVVEDNEMVRDLTTRVLRGRGYQVLEAQRGDEALRIAAAYDDPIDMLLTDVVMPHMSGQVLAQRLQEARPGIRILYMSGYTGDVIAQHGELEPSTNFLSKPFSPQDLTHKVRAVLDQPSPSA